MHRNSLITRGMKAFISGMQAEKLTVQGTSMAPYLEDGQQVNILPLDNQRLKAGRCYAFRKGPSVFLHRFVTQKGGHAVFVGDNTVLPETVVLSEVLGRLDAKKQRAFTAVVAVINLLVLDLFAWSPTILRIRRGVVKALSRLCGGCYERAVRKARVDNREG